MAGRGGALTGVGAPPLALLHLHSRGLCTSPTIEA